MIERIVANRKMGGDAGIRHVASRDFQSNRWYDAVRIPEIRTSVAQVPAWIAHSLGLHPGNGEAC